MDKNVGLFGGTFDPVHIGHIKISKAFLESGIIEELWVLLTPDPPHKTYREHAPYALRTKMLEAAFEEQENVKVSTVENKLARPTYTIQTLRYLRKNYPAYTFYLCIGEDSLVNFDSWYQYREILEHCELIVANRPGFDDSDVSPEIKKNTHFIEHSPVDLSSTGIRKKVKEGESISGLVPAGVERLIKERGLYT